MSERQTVALQLYTLRNETAVDMGGTLQALAAMGYEGVEMAGFGNLGLPGTIDALRANNLKVVGNHADLNGLQTELDRIIEENLLLENKYVVCSYLNEQWHNKEGFIEIGKVLTGIGRELQGAGMQLCYHNHAFEFASYDGQYGFDLLYANADSALVKAEIDTYWVKSGGADPVAYINKYAGRLPLLHIKDMRDDANHGFAEIGTGILDWPAIFAASDKAGVEAYIVEQDTCPGNPLDSVRLSIDNLRKMGRLS